jgi:hypothetical protein
MRFFISRYKVFVGPALLNRGVEEEEEESNLIILKR